MTPAGEILAAEIRGEGPIPFRRFMEVALYHPEVGYYRRSPDRANAAFGKAGDFYTAAQLQPVFGELMAARIGGLWGEMGSPADFTVVELGAGRGDMARAFSPWRYVPIESGQANALPQRFRGVFFSNEFFDALPVETFTYTHGEFRCELVAWDHGRFVWRLGGPATPELVDYLRRYFPPPVEGQRYEANLAALDWIERIARALDSGWVVTIDYGFTRSEAIRFPAGTLMGYHRHTAREDVLTDPGERDITAHVNFTALEEHGAACGLRGGRLETLAQTLIAAGESEFARVSSCSDAKEQLRRRLQLKTLLFGMGDAFRVLWQRKDGGKFGKKSL